MSLLMHNHYNRHVRWGNRMTRTLLFVLSFALSGSATPTSAQADQQSYRCVKNGKTTYTDKPCDAPTLPGMEAPAASRSRRAGGRTGKTANSIELDYTTPYGTWRGQARYQATVKGQTVSEAHVVVPLVIQVKRREGTGCKSREWLRMLGLPRLT